MTKKDEVPPDDAAAEAFKRLTASASQLRHTSDEVGKSVENLEYNLKRLNLWVEEWVTIREGGDPHGNGYFWQEDVGWAKIGRKWGIAIRTQEGNAHAPEMTDVEQWLFAESPRELRAGAVDTLPKLLDKLSEKADKVTADLQARVAPAEAVAEGVRRVLNEARTQPKQTSAGRK